MYHLDRRMPLVLMDSMNSCSNILIEMEIEMKKKWQCEKKEMESKGENKY